MDLKEIIRTQSAEFKIAVFWMLQEIRKEIDASISDKIEIRIQSADSTLPKPDDQRRVLRFLQNASIITIERSMYSDSPLVDSFIKTKAAFGGVISTKPQNYTLKVNRKSISDIYSLYENTKSQNIQISFNTANGALKISDSFIYFEIGTASYYILSALFDTHDEYYSPGQLLDFQTANEIITRTDETHKLNEKSFYSAKNHINAQILKRTGFSEFLTIKNKCLQLNYY
ncbi:MAG: hypothetical protein WC819_04170 [Parcubacteria group bacterium]|jgi:hypothetical protein